MLQCLLLYNLESFYICKTQRNFILYTNIFEDLEIGLTYCTALSSNGTKLLLWDV